MQGFQVGDKVVITEGWYKGREATVAEVLEFDAYYVHGLGAMQTTKVGLFWPEELEAAC